MKDLGRIEALYEKVDAVLERNRQSAAPSERAKVEAEQVLNDQAYFLPGWGQLGIGVDRVCRDAIRRRRADADRRVRRGWNLCDPDHKRLSGLAFESRVALVRDRRGGRGSPFARAMMHDEARNTIAHGKLRLTRIDMASVLQDVYVVQAALYRSA